MAGRYRSDDREDVWPAFGDTMLAFLLVLMLMLVFQVATNIRITAEQGVIDQVAVDQAKVDTIVTGLRRRYRAIEIRPPDGSAQEITLGSEALFRSGSAELSPNGRALLSDLVHEVAGANLHTLKEITVKGHTDDWAIQNEWFASNWELSTARATQVVRHLTGGAEGAGGIDPRRVTLVAAGYGEFSPVSTTEPGRNRRIELRLVYTNRPAPPPAPGAAQPAGRAPGAP